MAADREASKRHAGYARAEVTQPPNWHGLVAWDLLFNNGSTGLFLVAATAELARPATFGPAARVAYPIALVLLLTDLACLVLDLGSPTRFHHMLRVFKPTSPMSLGTWCLTAFSMPLTVVAAIDVMTPLGLLPLDSRFLGWVHWLSLIAGLLPALGSAAYKGVLFSTSSQPGWKDARWLGAYLVNSAFLMGSAGSMTIAAFLHDDRASVAFGLGTKVLLRINILMLAMLVIELEPGMKRAGHRGRLIGTGVVGFGFGLIVPMGFLDGSLGNGHGSLFPMRFFDDPSALGPVDRLAAVITLAMILVGAYAVRSTLVKLPHWVKGPDHHSSEA